MKKILVIFLIAVNFAAHCQESILLRFNYIKGDNYLIKMKLSQDMGEVMTNNMNFEMSQKITETTDDTFDSEIRIEKISMKVVQSGNEVFYDSSLDEEDLDAVGKSMKTQMDPMLNAVVFVKSNNLGEVTETKVEPNVMGLEDMSNQSSNVVYPKEAVSVGSSWDMVKSEKGMEMKFTYTVKSISDQWVVLDISGSVSGLGAGEIKGQMTVDKNTGIFKTSTINMDMTIAGQKLLTNIEASVEIQ